MNKEFRAIQLLVDNCKGCTKCMNGCPMEAIRLKNGKAVIYEDKCIDCGECIRTCEYSAYKSKRNTLEELRNFKVTIAVPTVTLYSQFGDFIDPEILNKCIKNLGFNDVFDITYACDIASEIMKKEIEKVMKPAIGVFCPSIEKLIKTSYTSLMDHLVKVLTPIEISAGLIREKYIQKGYKDEDIGIFHIATCVAWKAAVDEQSRDMRKNEINGVIPFCDIYTLILKELKKYTVEKKVQYTHLAYTGLSWSYPGGTSKSMHLLNYVAVDGIKNVKKILDEIVNGKMKDVDFIEAYACSGGCLGGIFLVENPYNGKRITKKYYDKIISTYGVEEISNQYSQEFKKTIRASTSKEKLSDDFIIAVKKMKYMNELINMLPGTDCGLCGSPSCRVFAEDVVRGLASLDECRFI